MAQSADSPPPDPTRSGEADGLLVVDGHDGIVQVLQPVRDDVAFTYGIGGAGGRNKGDGVFAKGQALTWMGVRYER